MAKLGKNLGAIRHLKLVEHSHKSHYEARGLKTRLLSLPIYFAKSSIGKTGKKAIEYCFVLSCYQKCLFSIFTNKYLKFQFLVGE